MYFKPFRQEWLERYLQNNPNTIDMNIDVFKNHIIETGRLENIQTSHFGRKDCQVLEVHIPFSGDPNLFKYKSRNIPATAVSNYPLICVEKSNILMKAFDYDGVDGKITQERINRDLENLKKLINLTNDIIRTK